MMIFYVKYCIVYGKLYLILTMFMNWFRSIDVFIDWLIDYCNAWSHLLTLVNWLAGWLTVCMVCWLDGWLANCMYGLLTGWLVGSQLCILWLAGWLIIWFIYSYFCSVCSVVPCTMLTTIWLSIGYAIIWVKTIQLLTATGQSELWLYQNHRQHGFRLRWIRTW